RLPLGRIGTVLQDICVGVLAALRPLRLDEGFGDAPENVDGTRLPVSALQFAPALYYPSTLQMLGLAYIGEKHPECL
ncbi:hypothetical protein ACC754_40450, partial [Rhizobium johnstonii]